MKAPLLLLPVLSAPILSMAYEVHEWGTFTTVSGSDGVLLPGLQREEETLPPFVHSHFGMENGAPMEQARFAELLKRYGKLWPFDPTVGISSKGLSNRPVSGVKVKMETPVIYFHSKEAFHAKVHVGFNGGTISQWYPARSGGESLPLPEPPADPLNHPHPASAWLIDFSKPYRGDISWDIEVLSPEESRRTLLFKAKDTINWLRARVPETNVVRSAGQTEGYLFYRGIGNFDPGLETRIDANETLHIRNQTGDRIPYLLIYENRSGRHTWKAIDDGIEAGETSVTPMNELSPPLAVENDGTTDWDRVTREGNFDAGLYRSLKNGIVRSGLLESEADAMIQTWWDSYFEKSGLRIFWIVPRTRTDSILPLKVEPTPEKTVRVIVGRSEVFRPNEEAQWLATSLKADQKQMWEHHLLSDRFGIALRQRIEAMTLQKNNASTSKR